MKRTIALLMLLSLTGLATPALARPAHPPTPLDRMDARRAPEIDPSVAAGALALLGGGLLVLRSRRRR